MARATDAGAPNGESGQRLNRTTHKKNMNIDKPDLLNFATQPVDREGRLHQSFTITLGVDLATGRVLPIDQAYAAAMQSLAPGDCLDMGLPKTRAEWLLAGNACAPRGQTASGLLSSVANPAQGALRLGFLAAIVFPLLLMICMLILRKKQ